MSVLCYIDQNQQIAETTRHGYYTNHWKYAPGWPGLSWCLTGGAGRRAGLHRQTIWAWERASGATPAAFATKLARVVDVLESEGVRFAADGVHLDQPVPALQAIFSAGKVTAP